MVKVRDKLEANQSCWATDPLLSSPMETPLVMEMWCDYAVAVNEEDSLRFNGYFPGEPGLAGVY